MGKLFIENLLRETRIHCYRRSIASGDQGFLQCGNAVMTEKTLLTVVKSCANAAQVLIGQVKKSIRGMPWHWEPKKDVISCEKLR